MTVDGRRSTRGSRFKAYMRQIVGGSLPRKGGGEGGATEQTHEMGRGSEGKVEDEERHE